MELNEILHDIQQKLKAPKNQRNTFGKYNYRSCEDILEAVKPLLPNGVYLTLSDEMVDVGGRVYVKATATLSCTPIRVVMKTDKGDFTKKDNHYIDAYGWAREAETKKGMDDAQITGAASSYARKYALNGLFCIDDTKDSDATNTHGKEPVEQPEQTPRQMAEEFVANAKPNDEAWLKANEKSIARIKEGYPDLYLKLMEGK